LGIGSGIGAFLAKSSLHPERVLGRANCSERSNSLDGVSGD